MSFEDLSSGGTKGLLRYSSGDVCIYIFPEPHYDEVRMSVDCRDRRMSRLEIRVDDVDIARELAPEVADSINAIVAARRKITKRVKARHRRAKKREDTNDHRTESQLSG